MATIIKTESDTRMYVNDKEIIKDMDGDWICETQLTPAEAKAFRQHLHSQNHG
jgi:hypothetical protein